MTYLVSNVRHLADQKGVDQTTLGQAAGVSQSTISRIFTRQIGDTGYISVQKLAAFFGVSMDDLVNRDLSQTREFQGSQTERLDAETLASAMGLLGQISRVQADPIDFSQDADALIFAYGLMSREPSPLNRDEAMQRVAEWLRARRQADAEVDRRDASGPGRRGLRTSK